MIRGKRLKEIGIFLKKSDAEVVVDDDGWLVAFEKECVGVDGLVPLAAEVTFLQKAIFEQCDVTDVGLSALSGHPRLESIDLIRLEHVTGDGYRFLPTLPALRELRFYSLDENVSDVSFRYIGSCDGLEKLSLYECEARQPSCDRLSSLIDLRHLDIGSLGIRSLGFLRSMHRLESLSVSKNEIGDAELSGLQCQQSLRDLSLNDTMVTDACGEVLVQFADLTKLHLAGTAVTTAILPQIVQLSKLTFLSIWDTKLTPDCVDYLKKMGQLQYLMIPKGLLSDAQWDFLKESLPRTYLSEAGGFQE